MRLAKNVKFVFRGVNKPVRNLVKSIFQLQEAMFVYLVFEYPDLIPFHRCMRTVVGLYYTSVKKGWFCASTLVALAIEWDPGDHEYDGRETLVIDLADES
jgi:hypothetical protein